MNWFILFIAGLFEVAWAVGLKYTDGFMRPWPTTWTFLSLVASFVLLGVAMKTLPVGTAYAVWVGIGTVGTVALGIFLFDESTQPIRLVSVGLICAGIVGLKLADA